MRKDHPGAPPAAKGRHNIDIRVSVDADTELEAMEAARAYVRGSRCFPVCSNGLPIILHSVRLATGIGDSPVLMAAIGGMTPDVGAARIEELKTALDRDRTGLAHALDEVRNIASGFGWIAEGSWSCYSEELQSEQVLRQEVGILIDRVCNLATQALRVSGALATAAILGDPLPIFSSPEQQRIDALSRDVEQLKVERDKLQAELRASKALGSASDVKGCPTADDLAVDLDPRKVIARINRVRRRLQHVRCEPAIGQAIQESVELMTWAEILLRDMVDAADDLPAPLAPPGTPEARIQGALAVCRRRLEECEQSLCFLRNRYAATFERLRELIQPTPYWHDYCAIAANGTVDAHERPTYHQLLNAASFRAEAAETKAAKVLRLWRQVRQGSPDLAARAREELNQLADGNEDEHEVG